MSYLGLLDRAAEEAGRGELLAAERSFESARAGWESSRIRAPLVEKGLEPVLRWGGRLFGRRSHDPVLPTFAHRAQSAREAIEECSRLAEHEIRELLSRSEEELGPVPLQRLALGLQWLHESRVFELDPAERWPLLRAYLAASRRNGREVDASLLVEAKELEAEARAWVGDWADHALATAAVARPEVAAWLLSVARQIDETDSRASRARWLARAARLALLAESAGPTALRFGRASLDEAALPAAEARSTLRLVAGLLCNETHLAVDGSRCSEDLAELGELAARWNVAWPPPELEALLERRHSRASTRALVAADWNQDQSALLLVRHHEDAPCDVLVLGLGDSASEVAEFSHSPHSARRAIENWIDADSVILVERTPPASIAGVLGDRACLAVGELEQVVPSRAKAAPAREPVAPHPLWRGDTRGPWPSLLSRSVVLLPRLAGWLSSDAFRSPWGRQNLQSFGHAGLPIGASLVRVLDQLDPEPAIASSAGPELQTLRVGADLRWPRLPWRPWPHADRSIVPEPSALAEDVFFARHPSPAQLAGRALRDAPSRVWAADSDRAREIAHSAAASTDPCRVGIEPEHDVCPVGLLRLLERWLGAALSDGAWAMDALWLYRALAECPAGDARRWLEVGGSTRGRQELEAVLLAAEPCAGDCELAEHGDCFVEQLEARREAAEVWVEAPRASIDLAFENSRTLVVDDLCEWIGATSDREATHRLDRLEKALHHHPTVRLWCDAGVLAASMRDLLQARMPQGRLLHRHAEESRPAARLWFAPAGYSPAAQLLGEESRALMQLRRQSWEAERGPLTFWPVPGLRPVESRDPDSDSRATLPGRAARPSAREVGVAWLVGPEVEDPLLIATRLATAATHAAERLICFDPRASEHLSSAAEPAPDNLNALRPGARLLESRSGRGVATWRRPLTLARFERAVSEPYENARLASWAEACGAIQAGERWVLGGATLRERRMLIETLRGMARESLDGGPLRARCVVWVGEAEEFGEVCPRSRWLGGAGSTQIEGVLRAVDEGRVDRVGLEPSLLVSGRLDRWARRANDVVWIAGQAERGWTDSALAEPWPAASLDTLREYVHESGALLLAMVDDPSAEAGSVLSRVAKRLDAQHASLSPEVDLFSRWSWMRIRPEDPDATCARCGAVATVAHPNVLCPECAAALVDPHLQSRELRDAVLDRAFERLDDPPEGNRWVVIAEDAAASQRLRARLGVTPFSEGEAPLLTSALNHAFDREVLQAGELWSNPVAPGDLLLTRVPRDPKWLRSLLWRLHALEWSGGTLRVLDHPVQWLADVPLAQRHDLDPTAELAGRAVVWQAARAEVEFRFRAALGSIVDVLRRRSEGRTAVETGLGPPSDPHQLPRLAPLALAIDRAMALEGRRSLLELDSDAAVESVMARESWVGDLLASLEEQGIAFGVEEARVVTVSDLSNEPGRAGILAALLVWCVREGLLRIESPVRARMRSVPRMKPECETWLAAARATTEGVRSPLPIGLEIVSPAKAAEAIEGESTDPVASPSRQFGIAGSGRSERLVRTARELARGSQRVLLLAPGPLAVTALRERCVSRFEGDLEIATPAELALAFLRHHQGSEHDDLRLRLVPAAASPEGEEIRRRLVRETSRLYAISAGRVPALESTELARVVEGEPAMARMAAASDAVDPTLLQRCAEDARRGAGWLHVADLRDMSRRWLAEHPQAAGAWRDRYAAVLVDDLHALHPEQVDFLDRLFPPEDRWDSADPILLDGTKETEFRGARMQSERLPRELVKALERLWRDQPPLPARPKARARSRGRVESQPVLNLEACLRAVGEILTESRAAESRTAVVIAHEQDRRHLAARLREDGHRVWTAEAVGRLSPPGPRELLAALLLAHELPSLDPSVSAPLVQVLLRAAPQDMACDDPDSLVARLRAGQIEGELTPRDRVEAFLAPLCDPRLRGDARESLREAARRVWRSGLLRGVQRSDAARGRLVDLLEDEGARSWSSVRERLDPSVIANPLGPGEHVWVARPEDLVGLEFDHVILLCTGYEPVERHYAVASRTRDRLSVLYSERDPFSDRS